MTDDAKNVIMENTHLIRFGATVFVMPTIYKGITNLTNTPSEPGKFLSSMRQIVVTVVIADLLAGRFTNVVKALADKS
ncbi:MAG: hypothetical protein ABWY25_04340 [Paenisporosarcina sp.]